jgi:hypothetical protein
MAPARLGAPGPHRLPPASEDSAAAADTPPWTMLAQLSHPRAALAALIGAVVLAIAPVAARAEIPTPTPQAIAAHADFVPYLDPPPGPPKAICLVDSGVNITPDTPPDNPAGPILARLALDGGSGEGGTADPEHLHGTAMAQYGAAPINGWGNVGFWPGARIVSIRAMPMDSTGFPFDAYRRGIRDCVAAKRARGVAVVNLSLGASYRPMDGDEARLQNAIADAHNEGISVLAASGNRSRVVVDSPADESGVLSVGAVSSVGRGLCPFSNGGTNVDLLAPGCDAAVSDPTTGLGTDGGGYEVGTSGATMTASTAIALVRTYRPDLTASEAERIVASACDEGGEGRDINLENIFRAAGLQGLVDQARVRQASRAQAEPHGPPPAGGQTATAPIPPDRHSYRLPLPRLKQAHIERGALYVSVRARPTGVWVVVEVWTRWHGLDVKHRIVRTKRLSFKMRVPRTTTQVLVYYTDPTGRRRRSPVVRRNARQLKRQTARS